MFGILNHYTWKIAAGKHVCTRNLEVTRINKEMSKIFNE